MRTENDVINGACRQMFSEWKELVTERGRDISETNLMLFGWEVFRSRNRAFRRFLVDGQASVEFAIIHESGHLLKWSWDLVEVQVEGMAQRLRMGIGMAGWMADMWGRSVQRGDEVWVDYRFKVRKPTEDDVFLYNRLLSKVLEKFG